MTPTTITCTECDGHDFALHLNDDGSTSLRCVDHAAHLADRSVYREQGQMTLKEALLRVGATSLDALEPDERSIFNMQGHPYEAKVLAVEALRRAAKRR